MQEVALAVQAVGEAVLVAPEVEKREELRAETLAKDQAVAL